MERTKSKTSPDKVEEEIETHITELVTEDIHEVKEEELKQIERQVEQFRKYDPSSPAKPTPKHLQRHMRNESMRFPSGDFSSITITPKKSLTSENMEGKKVVETKVDTFSKEAISQKEIVTSKVEEKLDDGERSPELVIEVEKDIAEATLRDKISSFESKMIKDNTTEFPKTTVKLTKEALKKHTLEQDHGIEYTQEFVRKQSKQISSMETHITNKVSIENEKHVETVKSVKETIQQFDSKKKPEDKIQPIHKTMRTDSTLVQVSSEEDSELLKKSTDSETETDTHTTVKVDKFEQTAKIEINTQSDLKPELTTICINVEEDKKLDDDVKKDDHSALFIKTVKLQTQLTEEIRKKVSEEEIRETLEEKDVSIRDQIKGKVCLYFFIVVVLYTIF